MLPVLPVIATLVCCLLPPHRQTPPGCSMMLVHAVSITVTFFQQVIKLTVLNVDVAKTD